MSTSLGGENPVNAGRRPSRAPPPPPPAQMGSAMISVLPTKTSPVGTSQHPFQPRSEERNSEGREYGDGNIIGGGEGEVEEAVKNDVSAFSNGLNAISSNQTEGFKRRLRTDYL